MQDKLNILVKTGTQEHAGTDANVYLILEDTNGLKTPAYKLDLPLYDDLERGTLDIHTLSVPADFFRLRKIYITRDRQGYSDDWFCDYIIIQDTRGTSGQRKVKNANAPGIVTEKRGDHNAEYYFPLCRWILPEHMYEFESFATCLPQDDPTPIIRVNDIMEKKKKYEYNTPVTEGSPAQCAILPSDEKFSDEYFWNFATDKLKLLTKTRFRQWITKPWHSFEELRAAVRKSIGEPACVNHWREDSWFGFQRVQGVNPMIIELCKNIPEKLDVTEDTVSGLLEDLTLKEALNQNKIFICDLKILDNIACKNDRVLAAPMALFYLNKEDKILPIAIQLLQKKGPKNPVFTPKDAANTWLVAKMYYNNAEAQHHQGITHLGLTHLLMEGVCVCTHRNLSPSHPVFKLIAPHFLFLIAINSRGLEKLLNPEGWVDTCMTQGVKGITELIIRGIREYDMKGYGDVVEQCKSRGVLDSEVLPYYPYRDDAVSLFNVIRAYVSKVILHYYDSVDKLNNDWELRAWRKELSELRNRGGVGLAGVPGDDIEGFTNIEELTDTVAIIISTCSLGHAASNFQQYDQYAFVPNYSGILMKDPPTEKLNYTERDIIQLLPDMKQTLDILVITKLLSSRGTNSIGDFEMQYLYDPIDVQAADEFRRELKKLSLEIKKRNLDRQLPFSYLDPEIVPNAISI